MRICDLNILDIRQGKNWKVLSADEFDWENDPLENLSLTEAPDFQPENLVVYSAIFVSDVGEVTPLVIIKEVQGLDYWGDSCEFVGGRWRQAGLVANPNAPLGTGYVADPLEQDDSFISDDDYRAWHREGFRKYAPGLKIYE